MSISSPSLVVWLNILMMVMITLFQEWLSMWIWILPEIVLGLKNEYGLNISLECAIPCPNQTMKWPPSEIARYNNILEKADKIALVNDHYFRACMLVRNDYMVDRSDTVLAIWNGAQAGGTWHTIEYAKAKGKQVNIIRVEQK